MRQPFHKNDSLSVSQPQSPYDVFSTTELSALTSTYGDDEPEGKFLRERNGVTHYVLHRPPTTSPDLSTKTKKGIVVLVHGLGNSLKDYEELSNELVGEGYTTLRYDYYGHGYSKHGRGRAAGGAAASSDGWVRYASEMFVDQLEDLLEYVLLQLREEERDDDDVVGIVGHGNGGVVAIAFRERWTRRHSVPRDPIPNLVLVAPAIYAHKPLSARLAERLPTCLTECLLKALPPFRALFRTEYDRFVRSSFARSKKDRWRAKRDRNARSFGRVEGVDKHPFFLQSLAGINNYHLRGDMIPGYRDAFVDLMMTTGDGGEGVRIQWIWGDGDTVVPFERNIGEVWDWETHRENFRLQVMNGYGHEIFHEGGSVEVAKIIVSHLTSQSV